MSKISKNELAEIAADLKQRRFLRAAKFFRTLQDTEPSEVGEIAHLVGISRRKALYLAKVDRIFRGFNIDESRLERLGWTKLAVLVNYVNGANCEPLLKLAEICTIRQLKLIIRDKLPVSGERCVTLYMTPAQHTAFAQAILLHGAVKVGRGLIGKEAALIRLIEAAAQLDPQNDNGHH